MHLELNQATTLFLAVALLLLGNLLIKKINFLNKFCIPAPVIGGVLFAIFVTLLKTFNIVTIVMDTSLQSLFMLAFFTTVGLGASFKLVKLGGKILIIYWVLCGLMALFQNIIGVSMAKIFNISPLLGLMGGAISMEGGHGAAAAFGKTMEGLGVQSATTIGLAAATAGLIAGGLIGGPMVKHLIKKYKLSSDQAKNVSNEANNVNVGGEMLTSQTFFNHLCLIAFCMAIGIYASDGFAALTGYVIPDYIGAMFIAVILRNVIDRKGFMRFNFDCVNIVGDVSLGIFLSMALMSIKLWQIADLALPLLAIVVIQVLFIIVLGLFVAFRVLGKDYDAAVMVGGLAGHGLGATPNAMANMGAVTEKFGPSPKAFLVVPIVGAFLIDAFAMPLIITFINIFK